MFEQANSREDHGHTMVIYGLDDLLITDRSAWLGDSNYAVRCQLVDAISEGKKCIRWQWRSFIRQITSKIWIR